MHVGKSSFRLLPIMICLVAVMWLAAACGDDEYICDTGVKVISLWLAAAREAGANGEDSSTEEDAKTEVTEALDKKEYCETNSLTEEGTLTTTPENTSERIHEVRLKYDDLFWRQPNVHGVGEGALRDANGERTGASGIIVSVTEKVDQSTLPASDRIPDCLEGVPVQIVEEEPFRVIP